MLAALPDPDRRHLLERSEEVELAIADVLCVPGAQVRHVFFPTTSFVSLITPIAGHGRLEVGLVGAEGMVGAWLALGSGPAPVLAQVQGAGTAWRVEAGAFRRELEHSPALARVMNRYLYVVLCQLMQGMVCTRFHVLEARLARWLLTTRDRAHADQFHVTHEILGYLLGVRRAGVTRAASSLHGKGLIRYSRGHLEVLDPRGLELAACNCYAADRATYARVLG
jgi:CRP-like cAMP-binding protein